MLDPIREQFLADLLGGESISLTDGQTEALETFFRFYRTAEERSTLLLTGSAGTGKTFMINLFTRILRREGYEVVLLAPTGRAAKVITKRTKRFAYTIHHHIYSPKENSFGQIAFRLKENKQNSKTVYLVDEASMIGDDTGDGSNVCLLTDLLSFVFHSNSDRKLILVGDPVQLPPIGYTKSPALDPVEIRHKGDLTVFHSHLSEVKRQMVDSGVLDNAVLVRDAYARNEPEKLILEAGRDVQILEQSYEALETYLGYYQEGSLDRVVFLTYSNWQATRVNQAIRHQLLGTEELLVPSDLLMVVKNNYAWGDPKKLPFIANGEMGTVRRVYNETLEERYGLKWIDAEIEFIDNKGEYLLIECKLILDLLVDKQAQIGSDKLYLVTQQRREKYHGLPQSEARKLLAKDPYINALQVKYGYAITGHKSQGGQWENVIIGFEPDYGQNLQAYIRWTYTVMTRAESRLFLINCPFLGE
ncbi:MAG: ATP-dependent RecD-like DNA helicase [Bacteroidia bacterium]